MKILCEDLQGFKDGLNLQEFLISGLSLLLTTCHFPQCGCSLRDGWMLTVPVWVTASFGVLHSWIIKACCWFFMKIHVNSVIIFWHAFGSIYCCVLLCSTFSIKLCVLSVILSMWEKLEQLVVEKYKCLYLVETLFCFLCKMRSVILISCLCATYEAGVRTSLSLRL